MHPISFDIFILARNQNYLHLIVYYYIRCSCCSVCFFLFLGDITEQITASCSIPWISFYQILFVLEILLSQLHVSFVTRRQAQYEEMSKAFDLGLGVFCLLHDFGHGVSPLCILTLICMSRCHIVWAETLLQVYKHYSHIASLCVKQAVEVLL